MICLDYIKQIGNLFSFFRKVSCPSHETANSCSDFRAETVNVVDFYLVIVHVANNFSCMVTKDNLLFFIFYNLSIINTIFVEEGQDGIFILLIAICTKTNSVFVCRLLCSF